MKINEQQKQIIINKLNSLQKSKFRSSFHLRKYMINYIDEKGFEIIKKHTIDFINEKLAPEYPKNDGKQTPTKGHPVFIAQHATATCCRGCLEKWHNIKKGKELTTKEKNYIYCLLIIWIKNEYQKAKNS